MGNKVEIAERTSVHLDLIRGVAALAVMLGHVRGLFFVDYPDLAHPSMFNRALYAVTGLGHQAVVVFFVLSGYLIGTRVWTSIETGSWAWRSYLVNRLTRLELVLLPALILGGLWDQIGMRVPQTASLYYGGLYKYYGPSVAARSTIPVLFGNLFFLQTIISPVFGSNGPLWSLSYEFWYYIIFPLLMLAMLARKKFSARLIYLGLGALLLWFVGYLISLYFLIWVAGAMTGRLCDKNTGWSSRAMVELGFGSGVLFAAALAWNRLRLLGSDVLGDGIIAACFTVCLFVLIHGTKQYVWPLYSRVAKTLAGCSYTLYLTHFPIVLLLRGWLNPQGNWLPDAAHLLYAMVIAALLLAFAYSLAEVTEAQTAVVRRRIMDPFALTRKELV